MTRVLAIVFIFILVALIVLEIIGIVLYADGLKACETQQSPYCYAITCSSTADNACGNDAYRCDNGKLYCSLNPTTQMGTC